MFLKIKKNKVVVFVSFNYNISEDFYFSLQRKKTSKMVNIIPTAVYSLFFSNIIGKYISKEYQSPK
jgi:hypothetical protein